MPKKKRRRRRGPSRIDKVSMRIKASEAMTRLYNRTRDPGEKVTPPSASQPIEPNKGEQIP